MHRLSLWFLLAALGCGYEYNTAVGGDDDDDDTTDEDDDDDDGDTTTSTPVPTDTGTTDTATATTTSTVQGDCVPTTPFSTTCTWTETAFVLEIVEGPGNYFLGLAETGTLTEPWTGEDCIYGYTTSDGQFLNWCHDAGDTGTSLTYDGDPFNLAAGTTVFTDEYSGWVTYYLESAAIGKCWVWGDDISYYDGLGCNKGP